MKYLTIIALLFLSACAQGVSGNDTAALQQKVLVAEIAYEAPLRIVVAYNERPRCNGTVTLCSDPAAVVMIRNANRSIREAFIAAYKVAATPGVSESAVVAAIAVATNGIGTMQSILTRYGVSQ
jgi:hypothetical protein